MKSQIIYISIALFVLSFSSCTKTDSEIGGNDIGGNEAGKSGSMAKFSISGNNLVLINEKDLKIYDISEESNPVEVNTLEVDFGIETTFTLRDKLFIGSINGVYIYDISDPANILYLSHYEHITSCDPVVANDTLAFVTLNSQSQCRWQTGANRLDVLDIKNIVYPNLISSLNMMNPKGLGIDDNYVFVCDGENGLKIFDFSNPEDLDLVSGVSGIDAYDVILDDNILYLVGKDGLFQYNYENILEIQILSNILF